MSNPIRLSLIVESPTSASIGGIDQIVRQMDASFSLTGQRITSMLGGAIGGVTKQLQGMEALLDRIASKTGRVGAGAGVGGAGLSSAQARIQNMMYEQVNKPMPGGFAPVAGQMFRKPVGPSLPPGFLAENDKAKSSVASLVGAIETGGAKIKSAWNGVGDTFLKISGIIYTARNIFRGLDTVFVTPIEAFSQKLIQATEDSRKFEIAIAGVVGGFGKARDFNMALTSGSANSPLTVEQLRGGAQSLALTPYASGQMTGGIASSVAATEKFTGLAERLSMISPDLTIDKAELALRQLMEGGSAGAPLLRRQFNLSTGVLASLQGIPESKLKQDPGAMMNAAEKFVDMYLPKETIDATAKLFSTRKQKLDDAISLAFTKVGNAGVYDSIGERLGRITTDLFKHFNSPEFDKQADRISQDLDHILGNVTTSIEKFLRGLSGSKADTSTVGGVVELLYSDIHRLASASDMLPSVTSKIGTAVGAFASKMGAFIDSVISIADAINDPVGHIKRGIGGSPTGDEQARQNDWLSTQIEARQDRIGRIAATGQKSMTFPSMIGGLPDKTYTIAGLQAEIDQLRKQQNHVLGNDVALPSNRMQQFLTGTTTPDRADISAWATNHQDRAQWTNFPAMLGAYNDAAKLINDAGGKAESPLDNLLGNAQSAISKLHDSFVTIDQGKANAIAGEEPWKDKFNTSMNALTADANNTITQYARALEKNIGSLTPAGQLQVLKAIQDGTTDLGAGFQKIFAQEGVAFNAGKFSGLPLEERIASLGQQSKSTTATIAAYARYGAPGNGNLSDAFARPLSDREVAQRQQAALLSARPALAANYADAKNAYNINPSTYNSVMLQQSQAAIAENVAQLRDLDRELDYVTTNAEKFGLSVRNSFENTLGKGLDDLIWRAGSAKDVLLGFAHDVTKSFSDMMSNNLVQQVFGNWLTPNSKGAPPNTNPANSGGLLGTILQAFGFGSKQPAQSGQTPPSSPSTAPVSAEDQAYFSQAGYGAVWHGGFMPLHQYGGGGVVNRPTFGLIGERPGVSEAVIPLAGNSVPVSFTNGGQQQSFGDIYVVNSPQELFARGFNKNKDLVINAVSGDYQHGGRLSKATKRRPG